MKIRDTARATALVSALAGSAAAQTCAPADRLESRLLHSYGETAEASGLFQGKTLMRVYANDETGTWTVVLIQANGMACVIMVGDVYRSHSEMPQGDPL